MKATIFIMWLALGFVVICMISVISLQAKVDRLESVHGMRYCYKVITGKNSSFETPSHKVAEKMIAKGYVVEECG